MLDSTLGQIGLFLASLLLGVVSSVVMAYRIDQIGAALGISEGLLGILTALGADAPEIAAAIAAIAAGNHNLGLGVIFGSNIFNFAALLGLSAVLVGKIAMGRRGLVLDVGLALWTTAIVLLLAVGVLPVLPAAVLILVVLVPYLSLFVTSRARLSRLMLVGGFAGWLAEGIGGVRDDARDRKPRTAPELMDVLSLFPLVSAIVLSSVGMVDTAATLGHRWGVPDVVVGTLILAALTGIPNMVAAIRLARAGRGAAVATETYTSNTINVLVGAFVPLALLGIGAPTAEGELSMGWLLAMTAIAGGVCFAERGISRWAGALLIALYLGFAALTIW